MAKFPTNINDENKNKLIVNIEKVKEEKFKDVLIEEQFEVYQNYTNQKK